MDLEVGFDESPQIAGPNDDSSKTNTAHDQTSEKMEKKAPISTETDANKQQTMSADSEKKEKTKPHSDELWLNSIGS